MSLQFAYKLAGYLHTKKLNRGFTLIELLVVIIIIGILAAISLPSFLNQTAKARQAEAKTYIGSLNHAQQGYYAEKLNFASSIDLLGVGLSSSTSNYAYTINIPVATLVTNKATAKLVAIRSYAGVVNLAILSIGDATTRSVLCHADNSGVGVVGDGSVDVANNPVCPTSFTDDTL